MRSRFRVTLAWLCLLLLIPTAVPAMESALFLSLSDGDSMTVVLHGKTRRVRLIGIDAPEGGQEFGAQAKSKALDFCYGKDLELEYDKERKDRYGRLLAYVYCDGEMLNEFMVRSGLAIVIRIKPNTLHYKRLKRAEEQAKKERRGFWLYGGLKQTPAQWRRSHKR